MSHRQVSEQQTWSERAEGGVGGQDLVPDTTAKFLRVWGCVSPPWASASSFVQLGCTAGPHVPGNSEVSQPLSHHL